jgi:hypothetical protein
MQRCSLALTVVAALGCLAAHNLHAGEAQVEADTALILAVDVSDSVDAERYRLQMEGIALALEDEGVINAITSGAKGGIVLSMVTWADKAKLSIPWQTVRSREDAVRFASLVRELPQQKGEYTCLARMMEMVREIVVPSAPVSAERVVVDVSGDGIDNCSREQGMTSERDQLLSAGVAINGLPILVEGENDIVGAGAYRAPGLELNGERIGPGTNENTTLEGWYRDHVIGGPGAFLITAHGFDDFGRAFRQKFVTEVSAAE